MLSNGNMRRRDERDEAIVPRQTSSGRTPSRLQWFGPLLVSSQSQMWRETRGERRRRTAAERERGGLKEAGQRGDAKVTGLFVNTLNKILNMAFKQKKTTKFHSTFPSTTSVTNYVHRYYYH